MMNEMARLLAQRRAKAEGITATRVRALIQGEGERVTHFFTKMFW